MIYEVTNFIYLILFLIDRKHKIKINANHSDISVDEVNISNFANTSIVNLVDECNKYKQVLNIQINAIFLDTLPQTLYSNSETNYILYMPIQESQKMWLDFKFMAFNNYS